MKRQILYFYRMPWPEPRAHGVQIAATTAALARAGAEVTLFVRGATPGGTAGAAPAPPGVRLVPFRWRRRARWPLARRLAASRLASLARRGGGAPVVYVRQIEHYARTLARLARRLGLPLIYEAHSIKCLLEEEARGPEAGREWEAMEREIFRAASGVVFTAPLIEPMARERFGFAAPGLLATNAAPCPGPPAVPRGPFEFDLLYVGQLYGWKGVDLLLAAMQRLPERTLAIAGGGAGGEDLRRARERAEAFGVAGRVRFLGQLPHGEALGLMARARAGVIPLPAESSIEARLFTAPLKLFEFWAAGLPVLASDLPSLRALVRDGETGCLVPATPEGVASGAVRLLGDGELARRISEGGRREAASRTWDDRARTILDFIGRVAS